MPRRQADCSTSRPSLACPRHLPIVFFLLLVACPTAFCKHSHSSNAGLAQLHEEEAQRVESQCGGAMWQEEFAQLHSAIRSGSVPDRSRRYLTFTCTPGKCGGIGDLFIGLVSALVVALVQKRALVLDYPWMKAAFRPATHSVDWHLGDDVPMMPARPPPKDRTRWRTLKPQTVVYLNLHNSDLPDDVADMFDRLHQVRNIRLLLNRGILVSLFTKDRSGNMRWRRALEERGLHLPTAFGCILRFLIKEQPEVSRLVDGYLDLLFGGSARAGAAFGIHIRTSDARTWHVEKVGEAPKLKPENVATELRGARTLFSCAERLERALYGPSIPVKWLLFSSSQQLKRAASEEYEDKVVVTDIMPMHIELKVSDEQRAESFKSTAAEWVLLSRCCSLFLFTESGFSKTAALYSLRPNSTYMFGRWADSWRDTSWVDRCIPDQPTPIEVLGNTTRWSGI